MSEKAVPLSELPVPRYVIGQKVWAASTVSTKEAYKCPDCLGEKTWGVKSPAGFEKRVQCPRCNGAGELSQQSFATSVQELTVGSVQINTAGDYYGGYVAYMCNETGIGSGSVYNEDKLFDAETVAMVCAEVLKGDAIANLDKYQGKQREEFRYLSQYQLNDAAVKEAESRSWSLNYRLNELLGRIAKLKANELMSKYNEAWEGDEYQSKSNYLQLPLDEDGVKLLQEHLMGYDTEDIKWMINWRGEDSKECKC